MLQRVRDLKVQFNNGTNSSDDKDAIAAEVFQIAAEVKDITSQTRSSTAPRSARRRRFSFQVGANDSETIATSAANFSRRDRRRRRRLVGDHRPLGRGGGQDGAVVGRHAGEHRPAIDNAIKNVSTVRANFGAVQNRLEHRLNNLATYQENLTASESRIRDVDMAAEMTKFTKLNILQQAGTSMLAQANQAPAGRPVPAPLVSTVGRAASVRPPPLRISCVSSPRRGRPMQETWNPSPPSSSFPCAPRARRSIEPILQTLVSLAATAPRPWSSWSTTARPRSTRR